MTNDPTTTPNGAKASGTTPAWLGELAPLFRSGFAGSTRLAPPTGAYYHGPRGQYEDLRGVDLTVPTPHDWDRFGHDPKLGTFRVYYEGGDASQRYARIIPDEADPTKKLLRFWIGKPNVTIDWASGPEYKARVQTELYGNTALHEVYQSVRLRLSADFALLQDYPGTFTWLTLMEFWNQPFWGETVDPPYPFRISLAVEKPEAGAGKPLRFGAHAQTKIGDQTFHNVWRATDQTFAVPTDSWMTLEVYYKEGDAKTGRFYVAVTPADGVRRVLIDVVGYTHHPDNPSPGGLTHYNPMKLYTSAELVEFVNCKGGALQTDWADFSIWQNRVPE